MYLVFPVLLRGNAGQNSLFQQAIPEPNGIITSIRKKVFGSWEVIQQLSGTFIIR